MTSISSGPVAPVGYGQELYDELDGLGFPLTGALLDLGAGSGGASEPLALRGARVTALDSDAAALKAYAARVPGITAVTGDALALPFADRSFDGVLAAQVLHHLDARAALTEAMRVTKPGGRVAVWWRELSMEDGLRTVRNAVVTELGVAPYPAEAPVGFRAFYAAPFRARELRVVPFIARLTTAQWLAEERAAGVAQRAYGDDRAEQFFQRYAAAVDEGPGAGGRLVIRFVNFVYVGITA